MSKQGNILLVANWESDVGYAWWLMENFWVSIATHFEKADIGCYLVYPKITRIPESITSSRIITHEHDFRDRSLPNLYRLHDFIRRHSIEFIYLSDSPAYSMYYVLLRTWGIRRIVVHDHTPGDRTKPTGLKRVFKQAIQRMPLITADRFIGVSEFVRNRLIEVNRIPAGKCSVAANGIVPIDLESAEYDYPYRTFDIPRERRIIVTTGRASYYKGIDFFIECAERLVNHGGNRSLHFLFCGDGPDLEDFRKHSKDLGLSDIFTFAGKRTDVRQILPGCAVGFHAAAGEVGYSLSILEYMSAGLVAVVPDQPSTAMAIDHMHNGILYKPRDIGSAASAVITALDENVSGKIASQAIRDIHERFTIDRTNDSLVAILDAVFDYNHDTHSAGYGQ